MSDEVEGIFSVRVSAATLERQEHELDAHENGALFIAYPRPPRVGTTVSLDLAFGEEPPSRYDAVVVWSRPARPGVVAGFRAQLAPPPAEVLELLRELVETARGRIMARQVARTRLPTPGAGQSVAIREKVSAATGYGQGATPLDFDSRPRSFLLAPREVTIATPPARAPAAAPSGSRRERAIELPDEDSSLLPFDAGFSAGEPQGPPSAGPVGGGDEGFLDFPPSDPPPPAPATPRARPVSPPTPTPTPTPMPTYSASVVDPSDFSDLASEFGDSERPAPRPSPPAQPIRVAFASGRSYLVHFERFLRHGELYITNAPPQPAGTRFEVSIELPDGDAPIRSHAVSSRRVAPPEVPKVGWVATLEDPSGEIAERFAEVSFSVTPPGA